MAESAYHNEALRRTRVIQRKNEAVQRKMNDCKGISQTPVDVKRNTNILFSGQLDFDTNSYPNGGQVAQPSKLEREEGVVFEEVVHDPNFKYRVLKEKGDYPLHVDPIYRIMYPGNVVQK